MTVSLDSRGVAVLPVAPSIDLDWATTFRDTALELGQTAGVRVVVLQAEGRFFNLGGDLKWMLAQDDVEAGLRELTDVLHAGVLALAELDAPVVARVQGPAAGAGFSLVLGADLVVASEASSFTMAYSGVGLSPDGGASWLLPRIVGHRRATDIIITNRTVSAAEAHELGIVSRLVPADELDAAVDELVGTLAAGPTASYGTTKRLLAQSATNDLATQLAVEGDGIATLGGSPTGREGVAAFTERRPPSFPKD